MCVTNVLIITIFCPAIQTVFCIPLSNINPPVFLCWSNVKNSVIIHSIMDARFSTIDVNVNNYLMLLRNL